ncbi:NDP-glycosyltransferase YjiC-like [Oppia nitens]|uniref:NDP-glycosyltransferase YjiC-like n=1 Tax=Oppia nitens TaxID=1686743 RepID=UPI0023DB284B|nr:NDP-glycosyltransferase YjiC-like [Oppia nitens]
MSTKYTIALAPLDAFGHVNACVGLAQTLRDFGHNCVFIVNQNWKNMISGLGFDYQIYIEKHKTDSKDKFWIEMMRESANILMLSPFEKLRAFEAPGWPPLTENVRLSNDKIKLIIDTIKPDAIITDTFLTIPAVVSAGVPWIDLISCNPLYYWTDPRLPPGGSGYATNSDKKLWKEFINEAIDAYSDSWESYNKWLQSVGAPALQNKFRFSNPSPFLNLYMCPLELNYEDIAPNDPELCFNIDSMIRSDVINNTTNTFEIPKELSEKSGKLVYLSMGTICCSDLALMKRLVSILSKSQHRFIVSKGPLGDDYELPDNMWGRNSLPQLQVIPLVDLVITHGGNNTVTESLYLGKPMIIVPVFCDQFDNAQRIVEKQLGLRLDPYLCSQNELIDAIDRVVNDFNLKAKYELISQRMQRSDWRTKCVQIINKVINRSKNATNDS